MQAWLGKAVAGMARVLVGAAVSLAGAGALAANETGQLAVTASVPDQCAVGNAALAMGPITVVASNGTMAALSGGAEVGIPWGCTNGTSATLAFGMGGHSNGVERRMISTAAGGPAQYLEYQLRAGSSAGTVIGSVPLALDGADGTSKTFKVWGGPSNSPANRTVKPAGDYSDAVVLTITFAP